MRTTRQGLSARGYVLPVVLIFGVVLATGIAVVLDRISASTQVSEGLLKRKQAFYAADGVARAATEVVSARLNTLPPAPPEVESEPAALDAFLDEQTSALQTDLVAKTDDLTPTGFTLADLSVSNLKNRRIEQLANGPFRGMIAQVQPFTINVGLHHTDLSRGAVANLSSSVQRGTVSMFQFFAFIDGYAYLYTGSGARFAGRIHANGNVCMGSGGGIFAEKVTSAGGFYLARSSGCRNEAEYHESSKESAWIARRPLANGLADLSDDDNFNIVGVGCSRSSCSQEFDRDSTGSTDIDEDTWRARALARWNGQLQDKSHGVPHLAVPIVGKPIAQMGRNAQHLPESNHNNTRFLVDPIIEGEPSDVRAQKLAYKADIRILNGVWYLRDPGTPEALGTPIWSDHPGNYTTRPDERWEGSAQSVGQADLFGGSNVPFRYSYYRTAGSDSNAALTHGAPSAGSGGLPHRPVISYGTLDRQTSGGVPFWVPGYYEAAPCSSSSSPCGGYRWPLKRAESRGELLQATRSGYRDGWGEVSAEHNDSGQRQRQNLELGDFDRTRVQLYNMLPINFDVEAFAGALGDMGTNELGSRLASTGRAFNGIVWIGSTWPGQLDGMHSDPASASTPSFWPFQGTQQDTAQPFLTAPRPSGVPNPLVQAPRGRPGLGSPATTANISSVPRGRANETYNEPFQQALPQPLCTDSALSGSAREMADASSLGFPSGQSFQAPNCAIYENETNGTHARPNVVRVINGRVLDHDVFPNGLTIATNLPAVVLGDFNANSVPTDRPGDFREDWRPALIASDTVTIQSSAWRDENAPWNLRISHHSGKRVAGDTTYHFQLLTGWLVSHNGNRDEVAYLTRLTENWCDARRTVRGSVVIGFNSVFGGRFAWNSENSGDCNKHKVYAYDYNLDLPANQPPGAPRFEVTAVERVVRN